MSSFTVMTRKNGAAADIAVYENNDPGAFVGAINVFVTPNFKAKKIADFLKASIESGALSITS